MRVVIVDPACFSPPYDDCLCEALARNGIDVTLARSQFDPGSWADHVSYDVWDRFHPAARRLKRLGPLRKIIKGVDHILSMRRFSTHMEQLRPDVIHFEWLPLPAVDLRFLPRLRHVAPLVMTVHDSNPFHGSPTSRLQNLGAIKTIKSMDRLVAHTEYTKRQLIAQGIEEDVIRVIPHGAFDYYETIARPAVPPSEPTAPTLLFFGSIKPYKGLDLLLKAFAGLRRKCRESSRLVIAGTPGMDLSPLRSLANQLNIAEQVEWKIGFIGEEDVAPMLRAARAIVLPYREIDQSGVLLAAIGVGTPIIATSVGGIPETIENGIHGLLVPPNDEAALTEAMETLLEDPKRGVEMRRALLTLRTTKLSWDVIARRTTAMYEEVLAATGRKPFASTSGLQAE